LVDINCPNYFNSFYLNVILFDYYSDYKTHNVHTTLNSRVDLSDNWWGEQGKLSLITYEKYRDITFNSYIDLNVYADSYIVHNGIISGVKITADLNYNSKKNEIDYKGYLPDGIPIKFKNQTHEKISYLSNGHASCYFDVSADITQFEINSNYMHKSLKLNRTACAKINVESTGFDEKGSVLKFDYDLHLDDSVNWISLIGHSISNFTDELDLIVDGNIVKNLTITNSFYNKYKSLYSDNVFNAIHMYNDFIYNNLSNIKAKIYVYNAITDNINDLYTSLFLFISDSISFFIFIIISVLLLISLFALYEVSKCSYK